MASDELRESPDMSTARVSSSRVESNSDIVRVRDASVQFNMDRGVSTVLDGIDLNIREGETLGVVGESGSGKSMFASALLDAVVSHRCRLVSDDDGQISSTDYTHTTVIDDGTTPRDAAERDSKPDETARFGDRERTLSSTDDT